jgi:hypothetical protein
MVTAPDMTTQPVGNTKKALLKAAQRRIKKPGQLKSGFGTEPGSSTSKKIKGKYVGKEKYGGLTKNAPKGKYKGKYIGPDRFKGDAAAYQKYKDEKAAKRGKIRIPKASKFKRIPPNIPTPKPGVITTH